MNGLAREDWPRPVPETSPFGGTLCAFPNIDEDPQRSDK
jgi:hypothetical protein